MNIVKLLLDNSADIEAMSRTGHTPLCIASGNSHVSTVQLLLNKGALVNEGVYCYFLFPYTKGKSIKHKTALFPFCFCKCAKGKRKKEWFSLLICDIIKGKICVISLLLRLQPQWVKHDLFLKLLKQFH